MKILIFLCVVYLILNAGFAIVLFSIAIAGRLRGKKNEKHKKTKKN